MKHLALTALALFALVSCAKAQAEDMLENYLWQNRLILIFAPALDNADLQTQNDILSADQAALDERDIVTMQFAHQEQVRIDGNQQPHISTNPFYDKFGIKSDEFAVLLIGKDGEVKLRQNAAITLSTLKTTIDAMPMRQRESGAK